MILNLVYSVIPLNELVDLFTRLLILLLSYDFLSSIDLELFKLVLWIVCPVKSILFIQKDIKSFNVILPFLYLSYSGYIWLIIST